MNAFDRAMRAIEKLMARGKKPVKRAATKRPEVRPGKRVVGAGRTRGSTPRVASGVSAPAPTKRRAKKRERRATGLPALREPFVPPVSQPDVSELEQTFAPAPTPPEVEGPITPAYAPRGDSAPPSEPEAPMSERTVTRPSWADAFERNQLHSAIDARNAELNAAPVVPPAPRVTRANCKVVDVRTGLTCKLGAHAGDEHGHERGRFHLVAAPGQHVRRAVDDVAWGTHLGATL